MKCLRNLFESLPKEKSPTPLTLAETKELKHVHTYTVKAHLFNGECFIFTLADKLYTSKHVYDLRPYVLTSKYERISCSNPKLYEVTKELKQVWECFIPQPRNNFIQEVENKTYNFSDVWCVEIVEKKSEQVETVWYTVI